MKKVLVCAEDKLFCYQIDRLLKTKQIAYDLIQGKAAKEDLLRYEVILIHASWRLPSLFVFVEHVVLASGPMVFMIQNGMGSGSFSRISHNPHFALIQELKLDIELPIALDLAFKFIQEKQRLEKLTKSAQNKVETMEKYTEAKRMLLRKGFTEDEAHQHILKVAMDHQMTKHAACLKILAENKE